MNELLDMATTELVRFLGSKLPELSPDWWRVHVVDRLTVPQQRTVQERSQRTLEDLDLSALLRVMDQNWYELSEDSKLPRECRNWIKELQTARNKWAHRPAGTMPDSEIYRDADTLLRLLKAIGAPPTSLQSVESVRSAALAAMAGTNRHRASDAAPAQPDSTVAMKEDMGSGSLSTGSQTTPPENLERHLIRRIAGFTAAAILLLALAALGWRWQGRQHADQKYFEEAIRYEQAGDDSLALDALDRAVTANPEFAQGYLKAAFIADQIDQDDRAREYLNRAEALSGRQSDGFRMKTEGFRKLLDDDRDGAISQFRLASNNYPRDRDAHYALADLALDLNRESEAEEALKRCFSVDPTDPSCHYTAMFLDLHRNRFDAVLDRARKLKDSGQTYPYWEAPVGLAYLAKGDLPAADQHFQNLSAASRTLHGRVHLQAGKDLQAESQVYRGRLSSAQTQLMTAYDSSTSQEEKNDYLVTRANLFAATEDFANARSELTKATIKSPELRSKTAIVYGIIGARTDAQNCLSAGNHNPLTNRTVDGLLALAEGNAHVAVEDLKNSYEQDEDLETAYWLGRALMAEDKWSDASEYYETIINSKGRVLGETPIIYWVLAHYQQAICYEKMQLPTQALQRYEEFLSIWKDADPELKQPNEARRQAELLSKKRTK